MPSARAPKSLAALLAKREAIGRQRRSSACSFKPRRTADGSTRVLAFGEAVLLEPGAAMSLAERAARAQARSKRRPPSSRRAASARSVRRARTACTAKATRARR